VNTLVIAQWREDLGWTSGVPLDWWVWPVRKDREPGDGDMPNIGREPGSFLWWIHHHHDAVEPAALYGFVQGAPFAHCPDLFAQLVGAGDGFEPLRGDVMHPGDLASDGGGGPHHPGLPVAQWYEAWLGRPFPGMVPFWAGGQFVVPGKTLLARPAEWYGRVLEDVVTGPDTLPWVLERLWPSIFAETP
jgi:hypothetical protein